MYIEQKQDRILKPHSVYTKSAEEDNQITTELLNLITEAGITPSANDLTQVKTAVLAIAGGGDDKADTSLSNLTAAGNIYGSKLSMPSSVNETLTLGASGTNYAAPSNGYFYISATTSAQNGYCFIHNLTSGLETAMQPYPSGFEIRVIMMAEKGDTVEVTYGGMNLNSFKFVYAEGSKTEA